jgi:prepilin-type N-terminal cleavage/methylation domain-containing protein
MKLSGRQNDKGFTLIETIIVIIVAAILAAMMVAYSNTSLTQSGWPLNQAKKAMALQKVMENIFTDYNLNYKTDLITLQTVIGGGAAGGNEGSTQNNYGQNSSGTNTQYTIVNNRFIKFDAANTEVNINGTPSDPNYGQCLKVTIKIDSGEILSILLTKIIAQ